MTSQPPDAFRHDETLTNCPLCETPTLGPAFEPDIVRCRDCRVYFRSPRPTQDEIARFYRSGMTYAKWEPEEKIRRFLWQKRMKLILSRQKSGRLLDIGTGDGHFLGIAQEAGFEVEATELTSRGVELSAQRGFAVKLGTLEEIDWGDRHYDVITLWHVLEHVGHPGEMLKQVYRLLKPGGVLAVAVPNEGILPLAHRLQRKRPGNPFGPLLWGIEIHLSYFDSSTFRQALKKAGFKILASGVDDVYVERGMGQKLGFFVNQLVYAAIGQHFSRATYCLCARP